MQCTKSTTISFSYSSEGITQTQTLHNILLYTIFMDALVPNLSEKDPKYETTLWKRIYANVKRSINLYVIHYESHHYMEVYCLGMFYIIK